eukprot:1730476-Rhodomonas_salina.4
MHKYRPSRQNQRQASAIFVQLVPLRTRGEVDRKKSVEEKQVLGGGWREREREQSREREQKREREEEKHRERARAQRESARTERERERERESRHRSFIAPRTKGRLLAARRKKKVQKPSVQTPFPPGLRRPTSRSTGWAGSWPAAPGGPAAREESGVRCRRERGGG